MVPTDVPPAIEQTSILDFLVRDDDISWQSVLMDAVKQGNLDPWDIDIGKLAEQFLKLLSELKEMNFTISGKVVLAAALLLKLKSTRFLTDDVANLDRVIADMQTSDMEYDDTDYSEFEDTPGQHAAQNLGSQDMPLYPRTPQPRRRKVSMFDLVKALDKALEVKNRRKILFSRPAPAVHAPTNVVDISQLMDNTYQRITQHYDKKIEQMHFSDLLPEPTKEAKIYTFIPLLHLSNAHKVALHQQEQFGDFSIELKNIHATPAPAHQGKEPSN